MWGTFRDLKRAPNSDDIVGEKCVTEECTYRDAGMDGWFHPTIH